MANKNYRERIEELEQAESAKPHRPVYGSILEQLLIETEQQERYERLVCFYDLLMQSGMTDDPRLGPIISEAHEAFKKWTYYDRPLNSFSRAILQECITKQGKTPDDCWKEFAPDVPFPGSKRATS